MSTLKVDTYLTRGGASEIAIDKLKGVTAVATINVVAEGGTVTTSLQQGLTKCFWRYLISNNTFADSLNVSGGTDNGTGLYTVAITNDFGSATAMVGTSSGSATNTGLREAAFVTYAVGSIQITTAYANGGGIDVDNTCAHINGDLA